MSRRSSSKSLSKSARLSRVLTERSGYISQPTGSIWLDYLEDSRVTVPPGVIPDKSRLSEGVSRKSKWWVHLEDSVNVPPPLTAESSSGRESPFSSGNEMSGKRPAPRRKMLRNEKRKRATDEGFGDIFHQDEQISKKRSSSSKHSSSESDYEDASPFAQPKVDKGKAKLFGKAAHGMQAKKARKSHSSKYMAAFEDSDDDVFPSTSRNSGKGSSESPLSATDKNQSPVTKPTTTSKKVLLAKKSRTARPDLEIQFSDSDAAVSNDMEVEKLSNSTVRSASPISKPRKALKKETLAKQKKRSTTSAFANVFGDEKDDGTDPLTANRSPRKSQRSAADKSLSPVSKSERLSKRVLSARKSRPTRPDLEISFSDDDGNVSNVDVEKLSSDSEKSPSPISKSRKKETLSTQRKAATTSAFDNVFSDDEGGETVPLTANRSQRKSLRSAADKSPSPVSKSERLSKRVLSARKSRPTRPDLELSFSDDEDSESNIDVQKLSSNLEKSPSLISKSKKGMRRVTLVKQKKRSTTSAFDNVFNDDEDGGTVPLTANRSPRKSLGSAADKSLSPATKSERTSKQILQAKKSRTARPDLEIQFSDSDADIDVEKLSSDAVKSPSPISKSRKKETLSTQRKAATTSAFDNVFNDDEDGGTVPLTANRSPRKSLGSAADKSLSPATKSERTSKQILQAKKSRTARPDLEIQFSDSDADIDVEKLSSDAVKSPSPISKSRKKETLSTQRKAATTSAFDDVFSDEEDGGTVPLTANRSPRKSLGSAVDKSLSPASKSERKSKQILQAKKSRTARPDLEIQFSDSDDDIDVEKLSSDSEKSPSPISKSRKKETLSTQRKASAFDNVFSDEEDGGTVPLTANRSPRKSLRSAVDKSPSPATKLERTSKQILNAKKSSAARPDLEIQFSDSDDAVSNGMEVEKLSNTTVRSASPISKPRKGLNKETLAKQKKSSTISAFTNVFSDDEGGGTVPLTANRSPRKSLRSAVDKSPSPATKLERTSKQILNAKKSRTARPDLEIQFSDSDDDIDVEKLSSDAVKSPSPISKSRKKETLSTQRKAATTSAFDNVLSDDVVDRSVKEAQRSTSDRNQSSATKSRQLSASHDDAEVTSSTRKVSKTITASRRSDISTVKSDKPKKKVSGGGQSGIARTPDIDNTSEHGSSLGDVDTQKVSKDSSTLVTKSRKEPSKNQSRAAPAVTKDVGSGVQSPLRSTAERYDSFLSRDMPSPNLAPALDSNFPSISKTHKDTTPSTLRKISGSRKASMMTPIGGPSTLLFAQEANFTNFNPRANSTKVLHVSNSLTLEESVTSPSKKLSASHLKSVDNISRNAGDMISPTAGTPSFSNAREAANLSLGQKQNQDLSDADVSVVGTWSGVGSVENPTVTDSSMGSSGTRSSGEGAQKKNMPLPVAEPPAQVPKPAVPVKKYTAEEAAARRKEYYDTLLERAKKTFPHLVAGAPVKQQTMTDFFPKATALPKVRKEPKPCHPSLMVNGKRWKPPKLARPALWCTERLYASVQKRTKELFGELKMRRKSEEFVVDLAFNVKKAIRCKKNFEPYVMKVVYLLHRLGLIKTLMDFYVFVENYMPWEFSDVAVPKARAYGVTTGPKCFIKANVKEPIDFSKYPSFEK